MKVTVIYGFLGAGKTTLLRNLLPELAARERIGLLVNEFGDVGIDGEVLSTGQVQVKELASGCICCTLIGDMVRALVEIHERWDPERLLIEPTGVAAPQPLDRLFAAAPVRDFANIDRVVAVVDAARFGPSREVFAAFYLEQIRRADLVVLNKVDRVSPEAVAEVASELRQVNPGAPIQATTYARIPIDWLLGSGVARSVEDAHDHAHAEDSTAGLAAHTVPVGCPSRARLESVLHRFDDGEFGGIVRAKGFVDTVEGAAHVEYVPGQVSIEEYAGTQRAFVVTGRDVAVDGIAGALG